MLLESEENVRSVMGILTSGEVRWATSFGGGLDATSLVAPNLAQLHDILLAEGLAKARAGDVRESAKALEAAASLRHAMSPHLEALMLVSHLTRQRARAVRKAGMPPEPHLEGPKRLWSESSVVSERRVLALGELVLATARRPTLLGSYRQETPWGRWIRGGDNALLRIPLQATGRWYLNFCLSDHLGESTRLLAHERSAWRCGPNRATGRHHEPRQGIWNRVEHTIPFASPEPAAWHLGDTVLEVELTRLVREARGREEERLQERVASTVCVDWAWLVDVRPGMEPAVTFVGDAGSLSQRDPAIVSHPPLASRRRSPVIEPTGGNCLAPRAGPSQAPGHLGRPEHAVHSALLAMISETLQSPRIAFRGGFVAESLR